MDLARNILFAIEKNEEDPRGFLRGWYDGPEPARLISYHLEILHDAGLVIATDASSIGPDGYVVFPKRLTWAGHEFLDNIRDEDRWREVKQKAVDVAGGLSFAAVNAAIQYFIQKSLGG